MSERVCIIHAGTHKTGTTSLQYFLQLNADAFSRAGIAFSKTGWYGVVPGNHHLAWELLKGDGDTYIGEFERELRALDAPSIIVSAEDFSLLHGRPDALKRLVRLLRSEGFTPKLLMYLREQSGFAESMYAERVKHGSVELFEDYVDTIVQSGSHEARGTTIEYRYDRMLDMFAASVGTQNILARPYVRGAADVAIFHDFLGALEQLAPGFRAGGLHLELHHTRVNESLTFGALLGNAFVYTLPSEPVPQDSKAFFEAWAPGVPTAVLDSRFSLITSADAQRFATAFSTSNQELERRFSITIPHPGKPAHEDLTAIQRELLARCIKKWRYAAT